MKHKQQTKPVLFTVNPPNHFDFRKPEEWKNWKTRFDRYSSISGLNQRDQRSQIDALIYTMGPEAEIILNSLILTKKERNLYHEVVQKLDDYFAKPKVNVISERAKFNKRVQQVGESLDAFIKELNKLAENCRFGAIKEELIRDRIVAGISDDMLSNLLQSDPDLTLQKTIAKAKKSQLLEPNQNFLQKHENKTIILPQILSDPANKTVHVGPNISSSSSQETVVVWVPVTGFEQAMNPLNLPLGQSASSHKQGASLPSQNVLHKPNQNHRSLLKINYEPVSLVSSKPNKTVDIRPNISSDSVQESGEVFLPVTGKDAGCPPSLSLGHSASRPKTTIMSIAPQRRKLMYTCSTCGKPHYYMRDLKDHLRTHVSKEPFSCEICGLKFATFENVREHKRQTHPVVKPRYKSSVGEKHSSNMSELKDHASKEPFSCEICGLRFATFNDVTKHKLQLHTKPFLCEIYKSHSTRREEKSCCEVCGALLSTKMSLKKHMRIHTGEKRFSCDVCGKSFMEMGYLREHHQALHSGEKSFCCHVCGKTFTFKSGLRSHNKSVHLGLKRTSKTFPCACGKVFYEKQQLIHHNRTHTGEKPFSCDMCDYRCAQKHCIKIHKRIHHRNESAT